MLCVVRNVGDGPLPEHTVRLHCLVLSGLDYTAGDTLPVLPAMARNQALAYRWRLAPDTNPTPLVAAVLLEDAPAQPSQPAPPVQPVSGTHSAPEDAAQSVSPVWTAESRVTVAGIPRVSGPLRQGTFVLPPSSPPGAHLQDEGAWLGNDRTALRVIPGERRQPMLLLTARSGKNWISAAAGLAAAALTSGEDGQVPWQQVFRWEDTAVREDKDSAAIELIGRIGTQWAARIRFNLPRDTSALHCALRLTALRDMRLYSVSLPSLMPEIPAPGSPSFHADGSSSPVASDDPLLPDSDHIAADRRAGVTFGVAWPASSSLADGAWGPLPSGDAFSAPLLGGVWRSAHGAVIQRGAAIEFPFRLFAFGPSDTVKDAARFVMP